MQHQPIDGQAVRTVQIKVRPHSNAHSCKKSHFFTMTLCLDLRWEALASYQIQDTSFRTLSMAMHT